MYKARTQRDEAEARAEKAEAQVVSLASAIRKAQETCNWHDCPSDCGCGDIEAALAALEPAQPTTLIDYSVIRVVPVPNALIMRCPDCLKVHRAITNLEGDKMTHVWAKFCSKCEIYYNDGVVHECPKDPYASVPRRPDGCPCEIGVGVHIAHAPCPVHPNIVPRPPPSKQVKG